jgi:hypothetical protein
VPWNAVQQRAGISYCYLARYWPCPEYLNLLCMWRWLWFDCRRSSYSFAAFKPTADFGKIYLVSRHVEWFLLSACIDRNRGVPRVNSPVHTCRSRQASDKG